MRKPLLFLFLIMFFQGYSQKITISGYITEKGSKELLPGVNIYHAASGSGTATNSYGFYSLTLPSSDSVELSFSFIGYTTQVKRMSGKTGLELDIELYPEGVELEEFVLNAEQTRKVSEETRMSTVDIPIEQIKQIPALLGEKDVLKVIQLMPGVQKGSEGSSGLYVRGGGPDQNLIILDDATVYNASHLFGFFSLFNGDALKSVELTKGGFPARYGGRLSSVLEMQMKDGNKEKLTGEAGIGIISSRLTLEGPIKKNKSSFLVSGRRTYIDALIYPFLPDDEKFGYFFYDFNAKANFILDKKNKLYVSGYFGKDKFYYRSKYRDNTEDVFLKWGNATATTRWNHQFNQKVFANTSLIFSDYKFVIGYDFKDASENYSLRYSSGIRDFSLKSDIDFFPNPSHHIKTGIITTYHTFTPSAMVVKSSFADENQKSIKAIYAWESAVYAEDDWKITSRLKANVGFRLSHFINKNKNYFNPEPRVSARYMIKDDMSVKASYAVMNQYIHLLTNTGIGLPTDLWVPTTDKVKPQHSQQLALGLSKDFSDKGLTMAIEGYYKWSENIIGYKEGASFLLIEADEDSEEVKWEDNVTPGKATSYGAEFLLQRKFGKLTGWIGYTLSWTWLQFDSLNFGKKFHARYDRRHDISVVGIYKIKENITLSATWVFGTGNAITLPLAGYNAATNVPSSNGSSYNGMLYSNYVSDYGEKNSFRMAPYHRFDIAVQFHKKKKRVERTFELGVYNSYNRKNPFYYYAGYDEVTGEAELRQVSLFPIIPSVSWTYKF